MKYEHILAAFLNSPWAILPEKLAEMRAFLHLKARGADIPQEEIDALVAARGNRPAGVTVAGRVAVLPVMGTICQRIGTLAQASGGVSTEDIGAALDSLVADRQVKCIVLAFDSPGGSVYGVEELARKIYSARDQKKIVGLADSVAASAAYWLLSQCAEINVTPGGQVGSIGVLAAHEDLSKQLEEQGVKTTLIHAGKYKVEGNPYESLSEEARAEIQSKVDSYYSMFVAAVARGRGTTEARVRADMGQGRMVTAKDAVKAGMADHVATLEQVMRRLGADGYESSGQAAMGNGKPETVIENDSPQIDAQNGSAKPRSPLKPTDTPAKNRARRLQLAAAKAGLPAGIAADVSNQSVPDDGASERPAEGYSPQVGDRCQFILEIKKEKAGVLMEGTVEEVGPEVSIEDTGLSLSGTADDPAVRIRSKRHTHVAWYLRRASELEPVGEDLDHTLDTAIG